MNERDWKRLLDKMSEGYVVPVLGPQLLVGPDGRSLQESVARHILKANDLDDEVALPPFNELNAAVSLLRSQCSEQDIYADVYDAIGTLPKADSLQFPAPIRQIAEIADFRLFVTLTPDSLLAQCLRLRCAVNEIIHSPTLPSGEARDLPDDWRSRSGELHLLYLFGKSRSVPMCAIHDEDILEYAHNIIANSSQVPIKFLNELQDLNLLLIGCNFPDWLSRFFLRLMRKSRLSGKKSSREWLVEQLEEEDSLTCFLKSYSSETEVLSQLPPVQFVDELHRRWLESHGAAAASASAPLPDGSTVNPGALFFISYSRATDLPRAEAFFNFLLDLGATENEIWFDRTTLEPGQDFGNRILEGIESCRYFLPLVSDGADQRQRAFVFREWQKANHFNEEMNREFLIPIIVDQDYDPRRYKAIPVQAWKGLDFGHAPEGRPDPRTGAKLKALLASARGVPEP